MTDYNEVEELPWLAEAGDDHEPEQCEEARSAQSGPRSRRVSSAVARCARVSSALTNGLATASFS